MKKTTYKKYILPGLVFQGVIIAGGYGTGRELVEYFMRFGPLAGILGMFMVTALIWGISLAITFEFSRKFQVYDYRSLLKKIIGPFWIVFEIIFLLLMLVILAVSGSAAGIILRDNFGIPYLIGVSLMFAAIGLLSFKGSALIEKFFSVWSILIYIVYATFLVFSIIKSGAIIQNNIASTPPTGTWPLGAFKYALYSLGGIPALLFCIKNFEKRKESILSGFIAALIGIVPAFLFYMALLGSYPDVLAQEIPAVFVLSKLNVPILLIVFQIVLFGTLIQTGIGFIHSFNERISAVYKARNKEFADWKRPIVALLILLVSLAFSNIGLIDLIAKGYGTLSWGFLLVFLLPLLTIGIWKIRRAES